MSSFLAAILNQYKSFFRQTVDLVRVVVLHAVGKSLSRLQSRKHSVWFLVLTALLSIGDGLTAQVEFTKPTWRKLKSESQPANVLANSNPAASSSSVVSSDAVDGNRGEPKPIVTRQTAFGVPFTVNPEYGAIREVQLHISTDQGRSWSLYGRQLPTAREFPFQAAADGEYWFAVKTIGSQQPVKALKPELIIAIDSRQPSFNVGLKTDALGRIVVSWRAADANLNPSTVKVEYQTVPTWGQQNSIWKTVDLPKANVVGNKIYEDEIAFYPETNNVSVNVRVSISDRAGNVSVVNRRYNLPRTANRSTPRTAVNKAVRTDRYSNRFAGTSQGIANADRSSNSSLNPSSQTQPSSRPPSVDEYSLVRQAEKERGARNAGLSQDTVTENKMASSTMRQGWRVLGKSGFDQDFVNNAPKESEIVTANKRSDTVPGSVNDPNFRKPNAGFASQSRSIDDPETEFRQGNNINRIPDGQYAKLSNSKKFELDYQVDHIRPTEIAALEIWITEDGGNSWSLHSNDTDKQSPVVIDVDEDGVYGYRIRIKTVDGLESIQPTKGDAADVWVEVDTTKPSVELTSLPYGRARDAGKLIVNWRATDKRLATKPITLFYSVNLDGPWQILVEKLPNSGQFKWPVTNRIPKNVFLRIEAIDAAGNKNVHQTAQAVDLSGLNPRGMIRSVRPIK